MILDWAEFLMIGGGLSLDIFGAIASQAARLPKISKLRMVVICLLAAGWQAGALFVGRYFGNLLYYVDKRPYADRAVRLISAAVFILMGIRMLWKAKKESQIEEVRQDHIPYKSIFRMLGGITLYTLLTGFAVGFLAMKLQVVLPMIAGLTALAVLIGAWIGYRFGAAWKTKAYFFGGVLFLAVSADVVVRYVLVE